MRTLTRLSAILLALAGCGGDDIDCELAAGTYRFRFEPEESGCAAVDTLIRTEEALRLDDFFFATGLNPGCQVTVNARNGGCDVDLESVCDDGVTVVTMIGAVSVTGENSAEGTAEISGRGIGQQGCSAVGAVSYERQ